MDRLIRLWDSIGLGLIIELDSGVWYSNQTGGTACLQPKAEGVFVPLCNDWEPESKKLISPEIELAEYFEGPKHERTGATSGLDAEDVAFLEGVLEKWNLADSLAIDIERVHESHEAWVHVLVQQKEGDRWPIFQGFGPYPRQGILTWCNSD